MPKSTVRLRQAKHRAGLALRLDRLENQLLIVTEKLVILNNKIDTLSLSNSDITLADLNRKLKKGLK